MALAFSPISHRSAAYLLLDSLNLRKRTAHILTGNTIIVPIGSAIASAPHLNGFLAGANCFAASALSY
jgi:hypothetical protein